MWWITKTLISARCKLRLLAAFRLLKTFHLSSTVIDCQGSELLEGESGFP